MESGKNTVPSNHSLNEFVEGPQKKTRQVKYDLVPWTRERYIPANNWYDKNNNNEKMFVNIHSYVRRRKIHDPSDYDNNVTCFNTICFNI